MQHTKSDNEMKWPILCRVILMVCCNDFQADYNIFYTLFNHGILLQFEFHINAKNYNPLLGRKLAESNCL